ncbi:hypothetical protein LOZ86_03040 [Pectobacterium parvum]|uniref:Uncharacterized protein n=1 Tax=Pectobacterium parvum TaxID=2778550 RepID=A0AAP9IGF1_9GAMM|nr:MULTISPECIES: hypothetical protein [Pectobacterium]GKW42033.1 hypothetical protein PEC301879_18910 [Pectobacterium carotovorum subsp. carotovorum]KFX13752.1 hypothetical protein KP17_10700 [Pectobacterium parvum]KHS98544.1 hypothetical protein RC88_03295 [Pectobacterium parvum]MCU1801779.1 hypothetical protein [Pectobacterium parvum]QHQ24250.1 hypothetical protein GMX10_09310 [Pectobacterium parvum]
MFISDKNIAENLIEKSIVLIEQIKAELVVLKSSLPQEEYEKCRHIAGHLIYTLTGKVINDISIDHPDLKPDGFTVYVNKDVNL